jgi:hypothetical protein
MTVRARSAYRAFHGRRVRRVKKIRFDNPKPPLICLGEAVAIEYACDKLNGGGDGKLAVYRHEFTTPVKVFMDQTKKRQLYIVGERLKVTDAGIEH